MADIIGNTCSCMICFISEGTPGIDTIILPSFSNSMAGAVPAWFASTLQLSGTIAWRLLFSFISRFLRLILAVTSSRTPWSMTSFVPKYSASVSFVISSLVGPSPPVINTSGTLRSDSSRAAMIPSLLSEIDVIRFTRMPFILSCIPIHAELVSMVCPISSSSPIVIISALFIFCK